MKKQSIFSTIVSVVFINYLLLMFFPFKVHDYCIVNAAESTNDDYIEGQYIIEFPKNNNYHITLGYNRFKDHIEIVSAKPNRGYAYNNIFVLNIPEKIDGLPVTAVKNLSLKKLEEFSIPDTVTTIENCSLQPWYTNYKDSCPDGVIYIGKIAYGYKGDKSQITDIEIKEGTKAMTRFLGGSFEGGVVGASMQSITLPSSLDKIPDSAFEYCRNLKEVIIPEGVKEIGNRAFRGCMNLEYVYIPDSVTELGTEVFASYLPGSYNCKKLERVRMSNNITEIKENAFSSCESLKEINMPQNLTLIGKSAFYRCINLDSVILPDTVERIEAGAFAYSGINKISTNQREAGDREIILPDKIKYLGQNCFHDGRTGDSSIGGIWKYIDLPTSVDEIVTTNNFLVIKVHNPNCIMNLQPSGYTKNVEVYGYIGSTAEEFAEKSGCKFIPIEPDLLKGDCNCDNKVNIADLVMLQKFILGYNKLASWKNVDLCEDECIDIFDMVLLRKLLIEQTK